MRRRKSNRVALSFAVTIVGISAAVGIILAFPPGPANVVTKHIPGTLPAYTGVIGEYSPADAVQVSFNNLTAIRGVNATALPATGYLAFRDPRLSINVSDVHSRVSIVLSAPNATVSVAFLSEGAFDTVSSVFNSSNLPRTRSGQYTLFNAAELTTGTPTATWVTLQQTDQAVISSPGALNAFNAVERILSVRNGSASSILDRQDVQRMFFTVNGTSSHLAVGVQNYPGVVTSGKMTLVSVDYLGWSLAVDYTVEFSNPTEAQSQMGYVMKVYLGAARFTSFDEFVQATEYRPPSSLTKTVGLVG